MKPYLRQTAVFIFFGIFILCSCQKENVPRTGNYLGTPPSPPPLPPPGALLIAPVPTDTSGGTIFSNLSWEFGTDAADFTFGQAKIYPSPYITIDSMVRRPVQVFMKFDTSSNWIYTLVWDWKRLLPEPHPSWSFPKYPYNQSQYFVITFFTDFNNKVPDKVKVKIL